MANIYLRISKYIASFYRGDGQGNSISANTPLELSPYSKEYTILANCLRVIPAEQQHRAACYSQSAWDQMRLGRKPQGGSPLLIRKPSVPLSYAEYCVLEGVRNDKRLYDFDFLCIAMPKEIYNGTRFLRSNATMTLDGTAARSLRRLLRLSLVQSFLDFKEKNKAFARAQNISRSNIEIIERFMMMYDMPVSHDLKERETLRRLSARWEKDARNYAMSDEVANHEIIGRIDEHEKKEKSTNRKH